jgi:hypothetical protein
VWGGGESPRHRGVVLYCGVENGFHMSGGKLGECTGLEAEPMKGIVDTGEVFGCVRVSGG